MTWKVYGFMESSGYSRDAGGEVYGPLPRKRWQRAPNERYKVKHKVTDGARVEAGTADKYNETRAIEYARWLAERDGIVIPATASARVDWSGFYSNVKQRSHKHWDGHVSKQAIYCRRICAVNFGRKFETDHYSTRKNGARGAWTHRTNEMEVAARIVIPNWDWEPAAPIEEAMPERLCA